MVLYGTIDSLIDFFSFTAWIFYGGAMVALIVMRYTKPNYPRPYKVNNCDRLNSKVTHAFFHIRFLLSFQYWLWSFLDI